MPYYTTEFDSPLPPPEVRERLRRLLWTMDFWQSLTSTRKERVKWPYKGRVDEGTFKLTPHPPEETASRTMYGTFEGNGAGGTHVRVRVWISPPEVVFGLLFGGLGGYWLVELLRGEGPHDPMTLCSVGLFAFIGIMVVPAFFWWATEACDGLMMRLDGKKAAG